MQNNRYIFIMTLLITFLGVTVGCKQETSKDYTQFVDPFIGTGIYSKTGAMGSINLFPGPSLPHGMVQLSPDTDTNNIAGYQYKDDTIQGFSHTHPSGTGCYGFGNILVMPVTGKVSTKESAYGSPFSKSSEKASPGYYRVKLDKYDVTVELTATQRAGMHKYTFSSSEEASILIDVTHNLADNYTEAAEVEVVDDQTVQGSVTIPKPFCGGQTSYTVYFTAISSKPLISSAVWNKASLRENSKRATGRDIGAVLNFEGEENQEILMKVGISYVSKDQARLNVTEEIPGWDFSGVRKQAKKKWNDKLRRIEVEGGSEEDRVKFYTALYHTYMGPYTASDVNGKYRGMDNKVHRARDHTQYHFFSLWDTFRAEHPLLILTEPDKQNEMVQSLLNKQRHGGWLPKWEFASRYTNCMIADHATSVIAESYLKNLRDYDEEYAYYAMKKNAMRLPRTGRISVLSKGDDLVPLQVGDGEQANVIHHQDDTLSFEWKLRYNDNKWHHYVLTYDAEKDLKVYMDSKLVGESESAPGKLAASDQPWIFGKRKPHSDESGYFTGQLDEIFLYNTALSGKSVKKLYSGQSFSQQPITGITFDSDSTNNYQTRGNPVIEEGKTGKSMAFDGIDDLLSVEASHPDNEFTLSFWIKTSLPSDFGGRKGLDHYIKYGYIPSDIEWGGWGTISTTLEDTYNDYALAQVAKAMGKEEDHSYFRKRAHNYQNLFDKNSGFMRPKNKNGTWKSPFDPKDWSGFTEGNSWSYTWFVPHNVQDLIDRMGKDRFIQRLDHLFGKFDYPEWHEHFSHYWHGNEPSQQVPYYYNYVGQPWKTQQITRAIMDTLYNNTPSGIPGNEDVGQLSAWFAYSAMGFYPVAPAQNTYVLGSPLFDKVTLHLDEKYYNASDFTLITENNSQSNRYIQSCRLNGQPTDKTWFHHSVIQEGGEIKLRMGPQPNKQWGTSEQSMPPSMGHKEE